MDSFTQLAKLIKSRRTVHQYTGEKIPDGIVQQALELSLWAPNHRLTYPWHYILVGDEKRAQLIELAVTLKKKKDETFSAIKEQALKMRLQSASHWLALGIKKNSNPSIFQEDQLTLACSVQIMSLVLWEQEVGTKWSTGGFSTHPEAYRILDLNPEEVFLMGAFFIGKPEFIPRTPERPELDQFLIRI